LVDDDRGFAEILSKSLTNNVTYATELQLSKSEVYPEERTIESRVSPLNAGTGQQRLLIEMIDVTRRARISRENALLIQHGAGRQMIRQLAHEIKNPLGGLRGAAQLLGKQLGSAELKEYTEIIISEADRLAGLVDTLLGPGGPPNKQPVNVHEIIEYVVRLLEPELEDKLDVVRDYDAGLPTIKLDRDQIIQALINLMRNAATALEGRGRLTLRTRAVMNFTIGEKRHPVVATIDIEDDGPGIPPELQDSVFFPLVTSRPDGTGLGLPTAQDLISRHDGLIEFESRPGRTVFSIRIPVSPDSETASCG
jgi:two-component system nitrogen regulation sensor histidine kinase GlnL